MGCRLCNPTPRLLALDAHRGLIMILMAIDHASYFIARAHSLETWGASLPAYPDAFWFWTRWITHPCAPGFFFLMGTGMALFAAGRLKQGWTQGQVTRFFVIRGLLLVLIQIVVEDPAWMFGDLSAAHGAVLTRGGPMPGGGADGLVYLGVLCALGASMLFWSCCRRASPWLIASISLAAVATTQIATPGPGQAGTLFPVFLRVLLIPGHTNAWVVLYPVVPWLGLTGFGLLFGELLKKDGRRAARAAGRAALACLALFVVVRTGGTFGNLNVVPSGWMGFLNVVKYPPSLSFLAITLSVNLAFASVWPWVEPYLRRPSNPLIVFGRAALFFYLVHLWIYGILGLFFRSGCGLVTMYLLWLLGLALLYPACSLYNRFKLGKPIASVWRFF